jgi:hypothetical protein
MAASALIMLNSVAAQADPIDMALQHYSKVTPETAGTSTS